MTDPYRLSVIPQVLDWLVTTFTDDAELGADEVQVIEGSITQPEQQYIAVGDVHGDEQWAALGARSRDETFTVALEAGVARPVDERADARARIFEILRRVAEILRTTPTMGIVGVTHVEFGAVSYASGTDEDGFTAAASFAVRVTARI